MKVSMTTMMRTNLTCGERMWGLEESNRKHRKRKGGRTSSLFCTQNVRLILL